MKEKHTSGKLVRKLNMFSILKHTYNQREHTYTLWKRAIIIVHTIAISQNPFFLKYWDLLSCYVQVTDIKLARIRPPASLAPDVSPVSVHPRSYKKKPSWSLRHNAALSPPPDRVGRGNNAGIMGIIEMIDVIGHQGARNRLQSLMGEKSSWVSAR